MKLFDLVTGAISSATLIIKGMLANPTFMLIASSSVGFIQIFYYRHDLTINLTAAVVLSFGLMTILGVVKHYKTGEWSAKIFVQKTVIQFVVMASVILLGYVASIIISVVFQVATEAVPGAAAIPGAALYFIFAGYAIMITYYFIMCCDLIDQIDPDVLPKKFSAPFRNFRKSGDYKDLLDFSNEEKTEKADAV